MSKKPKLSPLPYKPAGLKSPLKTVSKLRRFFEAIPADRWAVGKFDDGEGRYCAIGHYKLARAGQASVWRERHALGNVSGAEADGEIRWAPCALGVGDLSTINNGGLCPDRKGETLELGETPKERVVNALLHIELSGLGGGSIRALMAGDL